MVERLSFKEFMEQVEERLKKYPPDTVQKIVLHWAEKTHPAKRREFLNNLEPPPEKKIFPPDQELLREVHALARRVESGDYCDGWGWDDDIQEERDWGDETWVVEVDEFFARAKQALLAGHYQVARDAYRELFDILGMGEEPGHLPGSPVPATMLESDLQEAQACYLRAVYIAAPADQRPMTVFETMQRVQCRIGDNLNLQSVINADRAQLPDLSRFVSGWIDLLKKAGGYTARYLLREAVRLSQGTAGIARLARSEGKHHPGAYIDWIKALEKEKDLESMLQAAKDGLADVPKDYVLRAEIAKWLVRAGKHLGDIDIQLKGWQEAFYSDPSLSHLLSLLQIAEQRGCYQEAIDSAIGRLLMLVEKEKHIQSHISWEDLDRRTSFASELLLVQAYLLAGKYQDAFLICKDKGALGWTYGHNPKGLVIPFFFRLLFQGQSSYPAPNLERLWKKAMEMVFLDLSLEGQRNFERFQQAIDRVLQRIQLSEDERKKYVKWCTKEMGQRVDAIVGEKHRKSYHKVANFLVATAELLADQGKKEDGALLIETYRQKYKRHSAFKRELQVAVARGKLFR